MSIPASIVGIKAVATSGPGTPFATSPASNGEPQLLPLVGREYVGYYNSLNAIVSGQAPSENNSRPLSSMEHAESWLAIHAQQQAAEAQANGHNASMDTSVPMASAVTNSRLSSDQQSIHPLQVDSATSSLLPSTEETTRDLSFQQLPSAAFSDQKDVTPQPVVRKRASFASKLRKVFISKQANNPHIHANANATDVSSKGAAQQPSQARRGSTDSSSMVIDQQHRGSISSASSGNSSGDRRGSTQSQASITPSTSPEMSPISMSKAASRTTGNDSHASGSSSSSSSSSGPLDESTTCSTAAAMTSKPPVTLPPVQTRTLKKRLSFASISSFFNPNKSVSQPDTCPQEASRIKQQRSSSVPHIENPLLSVGRQIAGFQRRHSLNDLHEAKKNQQEQQVGLVVPSWNKNLAARAATANSTATTAGSEEQQDVLNAKSSTMATSPTTMDSDHSSPSTGSNPTAMATTTTTTTTSSTKSLLRLNNVFNKVKKNKKSTSPTVASKPEAMIPAKPLRPALIHRAPTTTTNTATGSHGTKVHKVGNTRRRASSVRSNQSRTSGSGSMLSSISSCNHSRHRRRGSQVDEALGSDGMTSLSSPSTSSVSAASPTTVAASTLSHKSLAEHQARINSMTPTAQQPHYHPHHQQNGDGTKRQQRIRQKRHRRQGSHASRDSANQRRAHFKQQLKEEHEQEQERVEEEEEAEEEEELCGSPVAMPVVEYDAFASPKRPLKGSRVGENGGSFASTFTSPPTPRVLPVATSSDVSDHRVHILRNPLSSLSPSSSCCSFTSDEEDEEDDDEAYVDAHDMEGQDEQYSLSSVSMSRHQVRGETFEEHLLRQYEEQQQREQAQQKQQQQQQQVYNPLLPAAAARISVDRIMMESQDAYRHENQISDASSSSSSTLSPQVPKGDQLYVQQQLHYQTTSDTSTSTCSTNYDDHYQRHHKYQPSMDLEPDHPHHHQQYYHPDPSTYPPRPPRQLQFSTCEPLIHPTWTAVEYDRTSDVNITALRLTPAIAHKIKLELNQFKSQEMEVHHESRVYTHFFV
ncbi:hypothetical protein BGZ94_007007 [Podila epigama]|nr:hypothetical protein BGZ94_007007 [Podila epigama]